LLKSRIFEFDISCKVIVCPLTVVTTFIAENYFCGSCVSTSELKINSYEKVVRVQNNNSYTWCIHCSAKYKYWQLRRSQLL